jgi:hypothetical protein
MILRVQKERANFSFKDFYLDIEPYKLRRAFIYYYHYILFCKFRNHVSGDEEHFPEERNFRLHFETSTNNANFGNIQQKFETHFHSVCACVSAGSHCRAPL